MRSKSRRFVVFTAAWALLASWMALPSLAQMHQGCCAPGSRMYNPATEITLKGSVEAVDQIMGRRGWERTQLSLKTEKETIDVRVGPTWFLMKNKMSFVKGDQVEVTGSQVKFADKDVLIAREIKRGGETFTLRNADGIPAWRGGHHRHHRWVS